MRFDNLTTEVPVSVPLTSLSHKLCIHFPPPSLSPAMPTCNSLLGNVQASLLSGSTPSAAGDRQDTSIHSHNHQASQHQTHPQQPHTQQPQPLPQPQHLQPSVTLHKHHLFQNHATHVQSSQSSSGPDPAVMEFISKIGQIIIKARTVSPTLVVHNQPPASSSLPFQQDTYHNVAQHSLENVLQDMELWRNSTPVHVNILHATQHALLERWVISFTPPPPTPVSPRTSGDLSR